MGAQVLDIAQRFRPDFVIAHLFGRAPSVSIKELKRHRLPAAQGGRLRVGLAPRPTSSAAGGLGVAEGYNTMQFAGVGKDYPVLNEIREMYKKQGKPRAEGDGLHGALQPRRADRGAARRGHPQRAQGQGRRGKITGEDVKKGFEKIKGFTLGGLVPPLKITPTDHEGGGWCRSGRSRAASS